MPGTSGRVLRVLVLLASGQVASGCDAGSARVPSAEPGAADVGGEGARSAPVPAWSCALPDGFSEGAPLHFPAMPGPVIGHRMSGAPGSDVFGLFLQSTVALCGRDEAAYFLRYRFYLTGPFSGRWQRPPFYQPI